MTWQEIAVKAEELRQAIQGKAYDFDIQNSIDLFCDAVSEKIDGLPCYRIEHLSKKRCLDRKD